MKQTIRPIVALTFVCGALQPLRAQDSSRLDLGYLTLNKAFTQQITIKGADLEKMPFTDLSQAIAAWAYGGFTSSATLQYVVDGNPVMDVNAISIHDIEEVVIVENAAATIGTAPGQAELVLIRTKRGTGPGGFCASAQTGLVGATGSDYTTTTAMFHNYYVGGYRNLGKISFGASANFIRDVMPFAYGYEDIVTPNNLQRWRLNGYFDWRPDDHNRIELTMNYTPQKQKELLDSTGQANSSDMLLQGYQHFFTPHLDWRGEWAKGLTNDLQGTYLHSTLSQTLVSVEDTQQGAEANLSGNLVKVAHFWVRDRLAYAASAGNWTIEPSINFSYEHYSNQQSAVDGSGPIAGNSLSTSYVAYTSIYESYSSRTGSVFLATPALEFRYKNMFDVVGGAMTHPGAKTSLTGNGCQVYPFGSITLDVLQLGSGTEGRNSLQVFASAASRAEASNYGYALAGFYYSAPYAVPTSLTFTDSVSGLGIPPVNQLPVPPTYWIWDAGLSYKGWDGRFEASYTLERRVSTSDGSYILSNGTTTEVIIPQWEATLHHADIRVKVIDAGELRWRMGLNVTLLRSRINQDNQDLGGEANVDAGDVAPNPWSWTGGWTNRLQVKGFTAGLDLLYHFGETIPSVQSYPKKNSFLVPNIYAAYRWKLQQTRSLEVFAAFSGFGTSNSQLSDGRQFYTVGANICL